MKVIQTAFALLLTFATAWGSHLSAKVIDVKSPNGELNLSVDVKDKIYYSVSYGNDLLLKDCYLNLQLENETLGNNPKLRSTKKGVIDESDKNVKFHSRTAVVKNLATLYE